MIKERPSILRSVTPLEIGTRISVKVPAQQHHQFTFGGDGGRSHGSRFATISDFSVTRDVGLRPSARGLQVPYVEPKH